jgi:hypothetical protein
VIIIPICETTKLTVHLIPLRALASPACQPCFAKREAPEPRPVLGLQCYPTYAVPDRDLPLKNTYFPE